MYPLFISQWPFTFIFFLELDWKKGRRKKCIIFYNLTNEPGLYMYFVLYALHEHMTKGLYSGQITKSN